MRFRYYPFITPKSLGGLVHTHEWTAVAKDFDSIYETHFCQGRSDLMERPEWCFDSAGNPYIASCKQQIMFTEIKALCGDCQNYVLVDDLDGDVICPMCTHVGKLIKCMGGLKRYF